MIVQIHSDWKWSSNLFKGHVNTVNPVKCIKTVFPPCQQTSVCQLLNRRCIYVMWTQMAKDNEVIQQFHLCSDLIQTCLLIPDIEQ